MDGQALIGDWSLGWGREFTIVEGEDLPLLRFPEAPPGCDARLIPVGEGRFRIEGGPYPDAEVHVENPDRLLIGGVIPVTRLTRSAQPPPGGGLEPPPLDLDDDELGMCERMWEFADHPSEHLDLDLGDLAPCRFAQWLTVNDLVIFHGSNHTGIEELEPVRRSMEVDDNSGRGNRGAVYGTHDGLWAMFFAVVDRQRLRGSIRSGVDTHWSASGDRLDLYHFSIHHDELAARPFTDGALYLLPRDCFERIPFYSQGPPSQEWACESPVRPLGRIILRPEDFPFLDRIGGHDDGELIELEDLSGRIYDAVVSAREVDGGIEMVVAADRDEVARMVEMSRRFFPDVERSLADDPQGVRLTMTGPPGFQHTLRSRFSEFLE
ncbi:MAG TPA: hypothetical protein VLB85_03860 [Acidimicrobiia bacterium]|nr:hypothetical protein [Acidimicrobiia bacterium]